jgi:hypothetical protein
MTDSNAITHEPFDQFNFNFEVLKLIEELLKAAGKEMPRIRLMIAERKVAELWDSIEREVLRLLEACDKAALNTEGVKYVD